MAVTMTIDGTAVTFRQGTLNIAETANGVNSLSCNIDSPEAGDRFQMGDEIIVIEDGTRIFGGTLEALPEATLAENGATIGYTTRITATDFNELAKRRYINATFPVQTLKARLTAIVAYIPGATLHASQVDGPADLPEVTYEDRRTDEVLNETSTLSNGYIWDVDYDKVLRAQLPGANPAPFNVVDNDGNALGDITVEPSQTDSANYVIVKAGTGTHMVDDVFAGDGVETDFTLNYPLLFSVGVVSNMPTNPNETVSIAPAGGAFWQYDPATGIITRFAAPDNGNVITVRYLAQFPFRAISDSGVPLVDRKEKVVAYPDVFDRTVALALAAKERAIAETIYRTVRYRTFARGVHPGQAQTITAARRNLNASCLITDVRITHWEGEIYVRDVTAVEGTLYLGSWRDTMRSWGGGATATGSVSGAITVVTTSGTGGPPHYELGGNLYLSRSASTAGAWIPVAGLQIIIDTALRGNSVGTVYVRLRADAGTVTARLRNVTDNITVGTSAAVSDTDFGSMITFPVTFTTGSKTYELQISPSLADTDVGAIGYLE